PRSGIRRAPAVCLLGVPAELSRLGKPLSRLWRVGYARGDFERGHRRSAAPGRASFGVDGMASRSERRTGAACAIAGSVLLLLGTALHPMGADPNDAVAAFTEYAADRLWVASHLMQLAGVVLMVGALLFLAEQ